MQIAKAWMNQLSGLSVGSSVARAVRTSVAARGPAAQAREVRIVPTAERIKGDPDFWARVRSASRDGRSEAALAKGRSEIAARSGVSYRPMLRETDEDGDDEPKPVVTYRTLCVRLCDGYYFPISFSAPQERFAADAAQCQGRCGSEARLFVHRNPDGRPEEMQDLQGRAYAQLPNAFLYRTQYVAACKCRPDPWEPQAKEQHQLYALAAAGDAKAKQKLDLLEKARREAEERAGAVRGPTGGRRMGIGLANQRPPRPALSEAVDLPDWARSVFQPN